MQESATSTTERILELLDAGLQTSPEVGCSTDRGSAWCVRCQRLEPANGELCSGCRAFLLSRSEDDPASAPAMVRAGWTPVDGDEGSGRSHGLRVEWTVIDGSTAAEDQPDRDRAEA